METTLCVSTLRTIRMIEVFFSFFVQLTRVSPRCHWRRHRLLPRGEACCSVQRAEEREPGGRQGKPALCLSLSLSLSRGRESDEKA